MKSIKLRAEILVMMLTFGIMLTGCKPETGEEYTLWTGTNTYSQFEEVGKDSYNQIQALKGGLQDGAYLSTELQGADYERISVKLEDNSKHHWTETEILRWFTGRNFGTAQARELTAWVIKTPHVIVCARTGSTVYILVK